MKSLRSLRWLILPAAALLLWGVAGILAAVRAEARHTRCCETGPVWVAISLQLLPQGDY